MPASLEKLQADYAALRENPEHWIQRLGGSSAYAAKVAQYETTMAELAQSQPAPARKAESLAKLEANPSGYAEALGGSGAMASTMADLQTRSASEALGFGGELPTPEEYAARRGPEDDRARFTEIEGTRRDFRPEAPSDEFTRPLYSDTMGGFGLGPSATGMSRNADVARPAAFIPETFSLPGPLAALNGTFDTGAAALGGADYHEPPPEQIREFLRPYVKDADAIDEADPLYLRAQDFLYSRAYDKAVAEGRSIIRREGVRASGGRGAIAATMGDVLDKARAFKGGGLEAMTYGLGGPVLEGAQAGAEALGDPGVMAAVRREWGDDDANRARNPVASGAGYVAGLFSPGGLTSMVSNAATGMAKRVGAGVGERMLRGAAGGAGAGLLDTAAREPVRLADNALGGKYSDPMTPDALEEDLGDAEVNALLSVVGGGVLGAGAEGASALAGKVAGKMRQGELRQLLDLAERHGFELSPTGRLREPGMIEALRAQSGGRGPAFAARAAAMDALPDVDSMIETLANSRGATVSTERMAEEMVDPVTVGLMRERRQGLATMDEAMQEANRQLAGKKHPLTNMFRATFDEILDRANAGEPMPVVKNLPKDWLGKMAEMSFFETPEAAKRFAGATGRVLSGKDMIRAGIIDHFDNAGVESLSPEVLEALAANPGAVKWLYIGARAKPRSITELEQMTPFVNQLAKAAGKGDAVDPFYDVLLRSMYNDRNAFELTIPSHLDAKLRNGRGSSGEMFLESLPDFTHPSMRETPASSVGASLPTKREVISTGAPTRDPSAEKATVDVLRGGNDGAPPEGPDANLATEAKIAAQRLQGYGALMKRLEGYHDRRDYVLRTLGLREMPAPAPVVVRGENNVDSLRVQEALRKAPANLSADERIALRNVIAGMDGSKVSDVTIGHLLGVNMAPWEAREAKRLGELNPPAQSARALSLMEGIIGRNNMPGGVRSALKRMTKRDRDSLDKVFLTLPGDVRGTDAEEYLKAIPLIEDFAQLGGSREAVAQRLNNLNHQELVGMASTLKRMIGPEKYANIERAMAAEELQSAARGPGLRVAMKNVMGVTAPMPQVGQFGTMPVSTLKRMVYPMLRAMASSRSDFPTAGPDRAVRFGRHVALKNEPTKLPLWLDLFHTDTTDTRKQKPSKERSR